MSDMQPAPATLLLVDDEANILASLKRLFRPQGYTVLTAESGPAALALMATEPVDLVISDMRMPQMSGAEFLEQVAARWPDVVRILLTGYADLTSTVDAINKGHIYGYFSKPWEDNEIRLTVRHALEQKQLKAERQRLEALTRRQNEQLRELNATLEQKVLARTEELRQTNLFLELAYEQLQESYFAAIPVFANLIALREGPHGGHGQRVAEWARDTARRLGMDETDARQVYFAGLLHDIGKLALPDTLLHKPYTEITLQQRRIVDKHPITGEAVLMGLEPLQTTARFIRSHHERPDGNGYPDRLTGDAIPLGARIIAVASDYDALRSGMLMGEKYKHDAACRFLSERRGSRYDGAVVDAFIDLLDVQEKAERIDDMALAPHALEAGMVLSRDLLNSDGLLLLTSGYRLTEVLIGKIIEYGREQREDEFVVHVRPRARRSKPWPTLTRPTGGSPSSSSTTGRP
jgi:response regulator RpfG family c-di-GMP phosphodiesterase